MIMKVLHVSDLHEVNPQPGKGPSSKVQRAARAHDAEVVFYHGDNLEGVWVTQDGHNLQDRQGIVKKPTTLDRFIRDNKTVLDNLLYTNGTHTPIDVYAVTGNHDGITNLQLGMHEPLGLELLEGHPEIRSLDFGKDEIKGREYGGLPGHKEIRPGGATPVEFPEGRLAAELEKLGPVDHLIAHTVPEGTTADMSHFEPFPNERAVEDHPPYQSHAGSRALRSYTEKTIPRSVTGGHIHESSGHTDTLGEALVANVSYRTSADPHQRDGNFYVHDIEKDDIEPVPVKYH